MNTRIVNKLKRILSIATSEVLSLYTQSKQQVLKGCLAAVAGARRGAAWLKSNVSINEHMARHGGLFVSFGLLLLAIRETRVVSSWGFIPPVPACFSPVLRIVLIGVSLVVASVVSWVWGRYGRAGFLKGWLKPLAYLMPAIVLLLLLFVAWLMTPMPALPVWFFTGLGIIALLVSLGFMVAVLCKGLANRLETFVEGQLRFIYWMVFWIVYSVGWIRGLSTLPAGTCAFSLALGVGLVLFFIIGFVYLRATRQIRGRSG